MTLTSKRFRLPRFFCCSCAYWRVCAACRPQAETTGPDWKIMSVSNPTNFKPGDRSGADAIMVTAINVGGASTDGSRVTISRLAARRAGRGRKSLVSTRITILPVG